MNQEQKEIIDNLRISHVWDERLLSYSLFRRALHLLTAREFFILEERIASKSSKDIAKQLKVSLGHIKVRCSEIKRIFETGERNDSLMSDLAYKHNDFYRKLRRNNYKIKQDERNL